MKINFTNQNVKLILKLLKRYLWVEFVKFYIFFNVYFVPIYNEVHNNEHGQMIIWISCLLLVVFLHFVECNIKEIFGKYLNILNIQKF